jgi:hypothetical protein
MTWWSIVKWLLMFQRNRMPPISALNMEALSSSRTLVITYETAQFINKKTTI